MKELLLQHNWLKKTKKKLHTNTSYKDANRTYFVVSIFDEHANKKVSSLLNSLERRQLKTVCRR